MPRVSFLSSAIESVDYDAMGQRLDIALKTGRAYRYFDVPQETFDGLLAASSKGRFYNDHIRDVFECVRLR